MDPSSGARLVQTDIEAFRSKIGDIARSIQDLTSQADNAQLARTVSELRMHLTEPYLFVIVGEVKSGKSSFINALLRSKHEICKVAPSPMTDTIQQIVWGEKHKEVPINPYLKKIYYPDDILKEFTIVDTPGTNTIIEHHQEITEQFIPASDLIVFVFEAKNPYRQSAWEFLQLIRGDWKKKVIFVLQQKDLMNADDLQINLQGVVEQAKKHEIETPIVFAVSALQELNNEPDSGFEDLRTFIQSNITGGKASVMKLSNSITTLSNISHTLHDGLSLRKKQYEVDLQFEQEVKEHLKEHREKAVRRVTSLTQQLLNTFDDITSMKEKELASELGFVQVLKRSVMSVFGQKYDLKSWMQSFVTDLGKQLNDGLSKELNGGIKEIAEDIQTMVQLLELKIKNSTSILKNDSEVFSAIAEKRYQVLENINETFRQFVSDSSNFYDESFLSKDYDLAPNVAKGTGLAVVGAMITALTHGYVFDITGGILTTLGVLFAGGTLGLNRRKILKTYRESIRENRSKLDQTLQQKLIRYIDHLKERVEEIFGKLEEHLRHEAEEIKNFEEALEGLDNRMQAIHHEINNKYPFVKNIS